jgi:hypothetical protein
MATLLELSKDTTGLIVKLALDHIKKIEANPDAELDNADPYDYWNSVELYDGTKIDYNVHEADLGFSSDEEGYVNHWHCSAYAVDEPTKDNPHYQIDTNTYAFIFDYQDGQIAFHDYGND